MQAFKRKGRGLLLPAMALLVAAGCHTDHAARFEQLTEDEKRLPENATLGLDIRDGLEVGLMASEPMLLNPTNIDVDDRGRVWVNEAYNYRPTLNGNPTTDKGDRILILEDADHDGVLDQRTVFYQGPEINAPLGICVLGNRVIVSQSPYVWDFYDDNGDGKADRKEILFQGIGGEQHDHGVHAFVFGPDGKLYFNFGNECHTLLDRDGNIVTDQDGDGITNKKYRQGMVFRCDIDGSNVEVLGHNFRNNYELAVDSYGTIWQSDNDDDGNRAVRINYVMEYGNYGYSDELTGAGWRENRTNLEDSIPLQHWHLNDPGVVPNLLQTGAGSPTGMLVYEGDMLPKEFRNQIVHSDAGPNIIRSYPVERDGAGYRASIVNLLKGRDQWFRPSDVCVAPDGSLIIADWYDPGVGGHQAGDQTRGRIYRIARSVSKYRIPSPDYSSVEGAIHALQSPNLSVRYNAWVSLSDQGSKAVPQLEKLFHSNGNDRMRARALWLLTKIDKGDTYLLEGLQDSNPDIRITAIRAAQQTRKNIIPYIAPLSKDKNVQVRRACAIALRHVKDPQAAELWATLASQHDGKDRWYLEALGIGAEGQWDSFFTAFLEINRDAVKTDAGRDIIWRARTETAVPLLAQLAGDSSVGLKSRLRYFRAFDFIPGEVKAQALLAMIRPGDSGDDLQLNSIILRALDTKVVMESKSASDALHTLLDAVYGKPEYIDLVTQYELKSEVPRLLELVVSQASSSIGHRAAGLLFQLQAEKQVKEALKQQPDSIITAIGPVGMERSVDMLENLMLSRSSNDEIRRLSAAVLGKSMAGEDRVLSLLKTHAIPEELIPVAVEGLKNTWRKAIYAEARSYLPGTENNPDAAAEVLTEAELMASKGNIEKGKTVFQANCATCHQVNGQGQDFGPKLSQIGAKLPKTALLDAIVNPSAGISFGYETSVITTKNGATLMGIVSSRTESEVTIRFMGGVSQSFKMAEIASVKETKESMMPPLQHTMSKGQLVDLIEYLASLK